MADTVSFPSNGSTASGYLCVPSTGSGPGVLVVQEWWGLDSTTKEVAERLAGAGFVALAPDLYHGELAGHTEMDKAGQLMTSLPPDRAAHDMSGAIDHLLAHPATTGDGVGVVGFCMGGMLSMMIAANRGDVVRVAVPFYGFPPPGNEPDWGGLTAVVRGHMAELDDFFGPAAARDLESRLQAMGKDVVLTVHLGAGHAFMATHNALGTHDAELADRLWPEVFSLLHEQLG